MTAPIRASRLPDLGLDRELAARAQGRSCIAGLDEVGRGPLAGPVVSAAVVLDLENVPQGLADSKVLTASRREALFTEILATSHVGIASVSHQEIDSINIRQASLLAMCRALAALPCRPDMAFVDGNDPPALPCATEAIVKGDSRIASIAAASIVAKVVRDRMMARLGQAYPAYGFASNAGYSTKAHLTVIASEGPCPFHRMSFSPLRQGLLDL
ncbi:ribonuclease HII [Microvirga sp. HBU67558]|uniref:ribonuclease HII n=1 Tax=Microvirga TaxID=186650 RepID=UPI001B3762FA|nr:MULTISPECIES: ribonuclease HII [unclassified Microvirga]MBQ0822761.1 ribonuclease HII [Microvirga sp. HBU67558]